MIVLAIYRQKDALQRIPARGFTERDMRVMQGISHQVSIVLDQAKLYREAVDKTMELAHTAKTISVIGEIDRSILSTLDAHTIVETATRLVGSVIPCDMASVGVVDRERSGFVIAAGFGFTSNRTGVFMPFESTSAIEVVATMRPQVISDMGAMGKPLPFEEKLINEGVHSLMRVPLVEKGEVTGTLSVGAKRRAAFTAEDLSTWGK
ncbi:MAG: Sigma-54 dependent transcriptional regulator (Modular protein) [Candidatus Brocadiaceae bacterium]|nr:Sigma-54 dependent transcriptional regulator (Modular protein) [Candidatus Brocadiaceae bacterium]